MIEKLLPFRMIAIAVKTSFAAYLIWFSFRFSLSHFSWNFQSSLKSNLIPKISWAKCSAPFLWATACGLNFLTTCLISTNPLGSMFHCDFILPWSSPGSPIPIFRISGFSSISRNSYSNPRLLKVKRFNKICTQFFTETFTTLRIVL